MKQTIGILIFLLVLPSLNSCKKKSCSEPEVWGTGTWKCTEYYVNGVLQDPSDPASACILSNKYILDSDGTGKAIFHSYSNNTCHTNILQVDWLENTDEKFIFITINPPEGYSFKYDYDGKNRFYIADVQGNKLVYERQ